MPDFPFADRETPPLPLAKTVPLWSEKGRNRFGVIVEHLVVSWARERKRLSANHRRLGQLAPLADGALVIEASPRWPVVDSPMLIDVYLIGTAPVTRRSNGNLMCRIHSDSSGYRIRQT